MKSRTKRRAIPSFGEIGRTFVKYNWLQPLAKRPFLPTTLVLYVTYRCNARCIMCGIWQQREPDDASADLSAEELGQVLADQLFADIEHLNVNGGEPMLRQDLPELVQVAISRLPRLNRITISTNGQLTDRLVPIAHRIGQMCIEENIDLSVAISFHGVSETSDQVFGRKGAFDRQVKTVTALRETGWTEKHQLGLHCVITAVNAPHLDELLHWSQEMNLPITFAVGEVRERFLNLEKADQVNIAPGQMDQVVEFLRKLSHDTAVLNPSAFRYHHLANMLEFGEERSMACHYAMGGVIVGAQGDLHYCPHSRALGNSRQRPAYDIYYDDDNLEYRNSGLLRNECLHCPPYTFNRLEFGKDLHKYVKLVLTPGRKAGSRNG